MEEPHGYKSNPENRRVAIQTLRHTKSMSRLRRLQVTGKTFFITCNLLPVRTQLTVVHLVLLPTSSYDDAVAVGCKLR